MHRLYNLKEQIVDELKKYGSKQDLNMADIDAVDKLAHAGKNLCKIIEACEEEEYSEAYMSGGSSRSMPHFRMNSSMANNSSYARGRGSNARRDSMGRYTSSGDFRMDLQELVNNAPNEQVRQRLMETMNMM